MIKKLASLVLVATIGLSTLLPSLVTNAKTNSIEPTQIQDNNYLMENDDISYEEVISNIDYDAINKERGIISSVVKKLFKSIPKKLKTNKEPIVDLKKFTNKNGRKLVDPKTGWWIEKDNAGSNSHSSDYKLNDPNKKGSTRHSTLNKDGKVLRE
ncbi:MAG: hypothetical protein RR904_06240 [Bacilli bacterium]